MNPSSKILFIILLVVNVTLVISLFCKSKDEKKQIAALKKKKEEEAIKKSKRGQEQTESENSEEDLKDEIEPKQVYSWIVGIMICLDIWLIGAIVTHWWAEKYFLDVSEADSRKALFGDSFGAVNALVSALAFAGMIVAFILQRYELRLQRKELKDNRAEMAQQTGQFAAENRNLEIQRFENLFYNMLNLQQRIVDGLRYDYYDEEYVTVPLDGGGTVNDKKQLKREMVGRDVFRHLFNTVPIEMKLLTGHIITSHGYRSYLNRYGLKEYDSDVIPSYFDHYFRHLYKIVQFVDSQVPHLLSFDDAYRYLSYVRGTLSRYELVWLYYNALYPDYSKFKKLIEKYSFLKALRHDLLTVTKETRQYYGSLGIDESILNQTDFGVDDFNFYLTDDPKDDTKYLISAFWNQEDRHLGEEHLEKWRSFISEKTNKSVVEEENASS